MNVGRAGLAGRDSSDDYPHPDHPSTWVDALGRQVERLSDPTRDSYLGGNVRRIYKLSA